MPSIATGIVIVPNPHGKAISSANTPGSSSLSISRSTGPCPAIPPVLMLLTAKGNPCQSLGFDRGARNTRHCSSRVSQRKAARSWVRLTSVGRLVITFTIPGCVTSCTRQSPRYSSPRAVWQMVAFCPASSVRPWFSAAAKDRIIRPSSTLTTWPW